MWLWWLQKQTNPSRENKHAHESERDEFNNKPCYAIAMPTCLAVYVRYRELDSKPCNRERWQNNSTLPGGANNHDSNDGKMPARTSPYSTPPDPPLTNISKRLHKQRHTRTFCATPHNWAIYTIKRIYAIRRKKNMCSNLYK